MAGAEDVPGFWDPKRRPEKPDLRVVQTIRFLTEDEFPPFNFAGEGGVLEGFNVDVARAICAEIGANCTIQARRFDTIVDALIAGEGDVIVASQVPTPASRQRLRFSDPYFRNPARFAGAASWQGDVQRPADLRGKRIAVVAGSAHEAYLSDFFPEAVPVPRETAAGAREALARGAADLVFGDGVSLAFWLNGKASAGCCQFVGGPYFESHYFGEGASMAMRKEDVTLERAIDYALFRLWERGTYADLVRRWFPVQPTSTPSN